MIYWFSFEMISLFILTWFCWSFDCILWHPLTMFSTLFYLNICVYEMTTVVLNTWIGSVSQLNHLNQSQMVKETWNSEPKPFCFPSIVHNTTSSWFVLILFQPHFFIYCFLIIPFKHNNLNMQKVQNLSKAYFYLCDIFIKSIFVSM